MAKRMARFPCVRTLEGFEFDAQPSIDPGVIRELATVLISSNRAVTEWGGARHGGQVVATAILDRLLHHSQVLIIRGDSYRLKEKRRSGLVRPVAGSPLAVGWGRHVPTTAKGV
jgi:DNA replication protein DnaC